jgi:LacI family transcriptional regulator
VEPAAPDGPDSTLAALVRAQHVDGLIVSGPRIDDPSLVALADEGFPIVIQGTYPGLSVTSVDVDNVAGARRAVEHLVTLGHRRIACITNAPLAYTAAQDRVDGYRQAMVSAGVPLSDDLVVEAAFDAPSGHRAMVELLGREPIDAVFVASDVVALGAIGALREAGRRVPDDVSVVGFDDIPLAAFFDPPLTTVRLPAYELGQAAGRALLERITGQAIPTRTLLPTELIVRASTGPPPGA